MNKILKLMILLPAIVFIVMGLQWLVAPAGVAAGLGLTLEQGLGLSSQIGDLASFFLSIGSCMLIALISERRVWFYPPMMMLAITAVGRTIAWLVHDATLAVSSILIELIVVLILFIASKRLAKAS